MPAHSFVLTATLLAAVGVGAFCPGARFLHARPAYRRCRAGAPALRSAALLPSAGEIAAFTAARAALLADGYTDSCRLCARHESSSDSLTIDLMGDTLLLQTWREPLEDTVSPHEIARLADDVSSALSTSTPLKIFLSHRGRGIKAKTLGTDSTYAALQAALGARWGGGENATMRERGLYFSTLMTPARDPGIHLDFRAGRRWLAEEVERRKKVDERVTVLNTFANTCTAGVVAAAAGASFVCNVDVSDACLADGRRNARQNGVANPEIFQTLNYDAITAMRMFAGLTIAEDRRRVGRGRGRGQGQPRNDRGRAPPPKPKAKKLKPRRFGVVVLDPPTFAAGKGGSVDIVRDYNSLVIRDYFLSDYLSAQEPISTCQQEFPACEHRWVLTVESCDS